METATLATLMDVALDYAGYVPTRAATRRGIPAGRLVSLAHRGSIERVGHGLYRMPNYPIDHNDDLILAVLWTNQRGAISHETALRFYELADVNPNGIDIAIPADYRIGKEGGDAYRLHRGDLGTNVRTVDGVRVVDVFTAVAGAIEQGVGDALVRQATDKGRRLGWITKQHADQLHEMRAHPNG